MEFSQTLLHTQVGPWPRSGLQQEDRGSAHFVHWYLYLQIKVQECPRKCILFSEFDRYAHRTPRKAGLNLDFSDSLKWHAKIWWLRVSSWPTAPIHSPVLLPVLPHHFPAEAKRTLAALFLCSFVHQASNGMGESKVYSHQARPPHWRGSSTCWESIPVPSLFFALH
jgi:hypothetical protein